MTTPPITTIVVVVQMLGREAVDRTFAPALCAISNPFFVPARDGCFKAQEGLADAARDHIVSRHPAKSGLIQIVRALITNAAGDSAVKGVIGVLAALLPTGAFGQ